MKNVFAQGHAPTQPRKHPKWTFEVSQNTMEWLLEKDTPPVRLSAKEWTDGRVLIYMEYVEDGKPHDDLGFMQGDNA